MKKFFFLVLFALSVSFASAQDDVTKFLGIPVDGPKSEMIKKLQEKGFVYDKVKGHLTGTFNGEKVVMQIYTNGNGDVWRVALIDVAVRDEIEIKIRFNRIFGQFQNNGNYELVGGSALSERENIDYGITVEKKRYSATFSQKSSGKPDQNNRVWFMINKQNRDYRILMLYDNERNNPSNGADL